MSDEDEMSSSSAPRDKKGRFLKNVPAVRRRAVISDRFVVNVMFFLFIWGFVMTVLYMSKGSNDSVDDRKSYPPPKRRVSAKYVETGGVPDEMHMNLAFETLTAVLRHQSIPFALVHKYKTTVTNDRLVNGVEVCIQESDRHKFRDTVLPILKKAGLKHQGVSLMAPDVDRFKLYCWHNTHVDVVLQDDIGDTEKINWRNRELDVMVQH